MSEFPRTPEQIAEHNAIHEWSSRHRPSREDLIASGDIDPEDSTTVADHVAPRRADLARLAEAMDGPIDTSDIPEATGPGRRVVRDAEGRLIPRNPIERLRDAIAARLPRVELDLDAPADESGAWYLGVRPGEAAPWIVVEWRPDRGFGISTPGPDDYGTRPDEIYADAGAALDRVVELIDASDIPGSTDARRAMRPGLRRAAEASWEHNRDGLGYLAGRTPCPLPHVPNAETEAVLRAADAGEGLTRYGSAGEMFEAMGIADDDDASDDAREAAQP